MKYSITFAIVLVMVSGFIAYFGDLLGRKMGKKRLSIFQLRPRYTAIVVTTITGMIISALVIGALLAGDKSFREAFTQWETVTTQNKQLAFESKALELGNKALQKRSKELEQQAVKLQKDVDKAQKAATQAIKARDKAMAVVSSLKAEITKRKHELDALRKRSNAAESELLAKKNQLNEVQKNLQVAKKDLKNRQQDLITALAKLTTIQAMLTQTQEKLADADKTLKDQTAEINEQRSVLVEWQKKLVELGNTNLRAEQEKKALRNREIELRSSQLIFRQGDELARAVISPRQSTFGIKGDIFSLLETASDKAIELGAKVGNNQRAVQVIYLVDSKAYLGENECIEMALNTIASGRLQDSDALVQVICASNSIPGEQVSVELRLYLNNLIYPKGKLITRSKIDGRQSEGRILLSVIGFLQGDVTQAALRAGIIPIPNSDPRMTTGADPGSQVEGLMKLVDQIEAANSLVKVDAFASDNIYAANPLNMDNMRFNVTKAE